MKWCRYLKWFFYPSYVSVRGFIESVYGFQVKWDGQFIFVNGRHLPSGKFYYSQANWKHYAHPTTIIRALKSAGLEV